MCSGRPCNAAVCGWSRAMRGLRSRIPQSTATQPHAAGRRAAPRAVTPAGQEPGQSGERPATPAHELTTRPFTWRNRRPSGVIPNSARCQRRIATSSGGMGTGRTSSAGRCLRPLLSCRSPLSVYRFPTSGVVHPQHAPALNALTFAGSSASDRSRIVATRSPAGSRSWLIPTDPGASAPSATPSATRARCRYQAGHHIKDLFRCARRFPGQAVEEARSGLLTPQSSEVATRSTGRARRPRTPGRAPSRPPRRRARPLDG